jgi:hypothetical protein
MKKLILLLSLLALPVMGQLKTNLTLSWDYPPTSQSTTITFYVFSSADISVPMSNWNYVAWVACVPGISNYMIPVMAGAKPVWFTAGASNLTGYAPFPGAAECPPAPRSDVILRVR